MQRLTSHLCLIPFRDFRDKALQTGWGERSGHRISAVLWQQLRTAVNVPGDGQEAEVGLCITENDAVGILPGEPRRYEVQEAEKRCLRPTATLARVSREQNAGREGSPFPLGGDVKKNLD